MSRELRWYHPAFWLRGLIHAYQRTVSSRTGSNCRYLPTCSAYAVEALEVHGTIQGSWLATKRVVSCNPWTTEGFQHQPVPSGPVRDRPVRDRQEPVDA